MCCSISDVVVLPGGGLYNKDRLGLIHLDVGVSSNADAETDKNQV